MVSKYIKSKGLVLQKNLRFLFDWSGRKYKTTLKIR